MGAMGPYCDLQGGVLKTLSIKDIEPSNFAPSGTAPTHQVVKTEGPPDNFTGTIEILTPGAAPSITPFNSNDAGRLTDPKKYTGANQGKQDQAACAKKLMAPTPF